MEVKRGAFDGVLNIIRFNWHLYLFAAFIVATQLLFLFAIGPNLFSPQMNWKPLVYFALFTSVAPLLISLLVSFYVYDLSNLYKFSWFEPVQRQNSILNVSAGFDESSHLLIKKFPRVALTRADFYDPKQHTEVSIKRARKAYPPSSSTVKITTDKLSFPTSNFDATMLLLSAHEVRNQTERVAFFKELGRVTKTDGQILVMEHLRDLPNFLAYNIGFMHFHSRKTWLKTFSRADLYVEKTFKHTPFITLFVLKKNGDTV